jgi:hypothetical protein
MPRRAVLVPQAEPSTFWLVRGHWWAWEDLNLRLHPYQGSAPGLVSPGSFLRPGRMMHRWRPLRTARLRWDVDQTWTRHAPLVGQRRSASRTLAGKVDPRRLPRQASPAGAIALLGGALAGSGPGTSPCIDGLSLVTAMGYPSLLPVQTIRTTAASWLRTPPGRPPSRSTAGRTVRWAWHDRSEASGRAGALPATPALAPLPLLIPVVSPLIVAVWIQVQPAVRALLQQLLEPLAAGKPE